MSLSRRQEQLARTLACRFEQPVRTRDLLRAWGDDPAAINALRSCLHELRRHLHPSARRSSPCATTGTSCGPVLHDRFGCCRHLSL